MSTHPFISILTPTYNRTKFISSMVRCYSLQTYPKNRMEWIVFDDGSESIETLFTSLTKDLPNIRYIRSEEKLLIGAKRNRLNQEAKGDFCIAMDDDDYYPPDRISHVVYQFKQYPGIELAGSSEIYMYFTSSKQILHLGPYFKNHATNGTLAYRTHYGKNHKYDETVTHAEERSFLDNYAHAMIQLDPFKTMLVMAHSENTFGKDEFLQQVNDPKNQNPILRKTRLKLGDIIRDKNLREFYKSA